MQTGQVSNLTVTVKEGRKKMKYRKTALVEAEQFLPSIGQIPSGVISDGNGDPRRNPECYSWIVASLEGNHHAKDKRGLSRVILESVGIKIVEDQQ